MKITVFRKGRTRLTLIKAAAHAWRYFYQIFGLCIVVPGIGSGN